MNKELKILSFGAIQAVLPQSPLMFAFAEDTATLKQQLETMFPDLKNHQYAIAVDKKVQTGNAALAPGCEIALLPPFSGG